MTIETEVQLATSAKASGFRFVQSDVVSVLSVTARRDTSDTKLRDALESCAVRYEPFLLSLLSHDPQARVFLFVATPFWDQQNALGRRRGVWGNEDMTWLPSGTPRSESFEVEQRGASRFIGVTSVPTGAFFEAADFVRTHGSSFLFVSSRNELADERVHSLFADVLRDSAVDWASAIEQVDDRTACIRVTGAFDDREVSIDTFASPDLAAVFRSLLRDP